MMILTALLTLIGTIGIFLIMNKLYHKIHNPFLLPALTSTFVIVVVLLSLGVSYETYMVGGQWIDALLGPAVVSLAYPLYRQRYVLRRYLLPIGVGVAAGSVTGMFTGIGLTKLLQFNQDLVYSVLPKSITTPVAMEITTDLGGVPSLTVIFVMFAGFTGAVLGPYVLKAVRLTTFIGRGIGFGSASHAVGTAKAYEYGEDAASVSSVAMTLSAIIGSLIAPVMAWLFYNL
ncbi:hypothetical protein N781_05170 [Pontibacillus halophilus JSM 076056 = DSM 19796]|uniref:LrgB n=1 Tax=Pontibacillus halophilus JSM 076056 = DSM 19796 TaxID=1385510 RepID=A0A0A5GGI6_9BACI|nr:LrgB family protein [Pontibacillus halophilus]KGX91094.1 hypothetical protein N781_05170 [Pontibacillus halophilus JSM 076056 = DSM 19796]